jgi:Zn ribbon nucleic-acid-binding protein
MSVAECVHLHIHELPLSGECPLIEHEAVFRFGIDFAYDSTDIGDSMAQWHGIADCPKCGNKGTLIVYGEASTLEIDGCWVCGYGRERNVVAPHFVPIKDLRIEKRPPSPAGPGA